MIISASRHKYYKVFFFFFFLISLSSSAVANTSIKVGVFDYAPLNSTEAPEKEGGLLIDILKYVAGEEKWHLQFVPGTLQEGLSRLNKGDIDLLIAAPYSPKMAKLYDFTQEAVISTWAQIYSSSDKPVIQSLLDLKRLSVGLVRDDPYSQELRETVKRLNIICDFVEFNNYEELFKAIQDKWLDAGAVDRLYGILHGKEYAVVSSPIIFSPVELRFAVAKNRYPLIIETLNYHITLLKKNPHSIYYQLIDKLSGTTRDSRLFVVLKWVVVLALGSLLLFSLMILFLRFQVKKKTAELIKNNQELENEIGMRQKAEEALRESEELYRTMAERSFANVYVVQDGRFRFINSNTIKTIGMPADEIIGQRSLHFVYDDDCAQVKKNSRIMLQGRRTAPYEYRMMTQTGPRWMLETVTFIHFEGRPAVLGTAMDISEQKKAEEERRILESQLRQAQKMEAIGTLAGGIAHDFNNILTAIMGYSELAHRSLIGKKQERRYLNEVLNGCERAKELINQILTFSRQSEHTLQPMSISPVIKETVKLLRASLPSTIMIQLNIEAEQDSVLGDPTQIHQVLMNLCTNAAHAMDGRNGVLTIEMKAHQALQGDATEGDHTSGSQLEIIVSDTGHGIPAVIMDRIFDPFFTTKEIGKGTGMGLSVVHGIVKAHGGKIRVESDIDKGSTFRVFIPQLTITDVQPKQESAKTLTVGNERILWVDDEEIIVDMGQEILSRLGYHVVTATSSKEAAQLFRNEANRFDLVISDMTMPYMTGIDLAQELLRIRHDIPIILCTGLGNAITKETLKAAGVRELMTKPFSHEKLASTVRRVLNQREKVGIDIPDDVNKNKIHVDAGSIRQKDNASLSLRC
ncbi:MAG: ATP-binding protein [Syntrophales bacterium]|nr:ATP-binding protein [Syntrophales bacterium]